MNIDLVFFFYQLHDFFVCNALAPKPLLALANHAFTYSLNKPEIKANSKPIPPHCRDDAPSETSERDPAPASTKQDKQGKKKGENAPADANSDAAAPNIGDVLTALMAMKEQRDHEQSRAEQEKRNKQRDTLTQKRCGFFFCGPSNTVGGRMGRGGAWHGGFTLSCVKFCIYNLSHC